MSWLQDRRETPRAAATRLVLSCARDRDLDRANSIVKTLNAILDRTKVLADISMQRQDQCTYTYAGSDYRRHQHAEGDPLFSAHVIDYAIGRRSGSVESVRPRCAGTQSRSANTYSAFPVCGW
jgi:hypothetical protein